MKIATLTWYRGNNYGSILQAYALPRVVESMGHECELLAYAPTRQDNRKLMLKNLAWREYIAYKANALRMKITGGEENTSTGQREVFDNFRKEKMRITPLHSTAEQLCAANRKYDAFICGSDQIWNPCIFNPVFFLKFVPETNRKISYAPSLGVSHIPVHIRKDLKEAVSKFSMLSVREQKGAELIEELTGQQAKVVVDPTLLLTKEQWETIAKPMDEETAQPYLFCYFLSKNSFYMEHAKRIADQYGLKIRMLPMVAADFAKPETIKTPVGPGEWITLIKNASFVLTDSFHCSVFAMIFGKDFYTFQRFADHNVRGQNSRVHQLLGRAHMEDRLISNGSAITYEKLTQERYQKAYEAMQPWIEESRTWLSEQLANVQRSLQHD